jgi:hypothetical protein
VTSPLERRYRRVLRLLPDGYRQAWEEEMVTTLLASSDRGEAVRNGRPSLGERMSVVALAVRLRLGATRPVTDVRLRHRVLYCVALMVLLYLALIGTSGIVSVVQRFVVYAQGELEFRGSDASFVATTAGAGLIGLLWAVAFWSFVHGPVCPAAVDHAGHARRSARAGRDFD